MLSNQFEDLLFEINLVFPENKNAIEAFSQMSKFYEILNEFDKVIIRNFGTNFILEYGLENVEFSSLKTKLVQILKSIPDDLIKDLEFKKVLGYFLVKAKYWLIKLLSEEKEITNKEQIQKVTDIINEEMNKIGIAYKIMITQVNNYTILNAVDDLAKETNNLKEKETLEYKSKAGNCFLQKGVFINKPKILAELGQKTIVNETTELLKIKKIDILTEEPKWDFLQGKKLLSAKMLDKNWLDSFHSRKIIIKPEDALLVTLRTTHTYNPNFNDKKTDCEVINIISIISPDDLNVQQMKIDNI